MNGNLKTGGPTMGELPPLQWLATFRAVMESGSFARAGAVLNLTPSAISHQMRALESRLGRPLFLRRNRSVVPTEDAILYAASISESFARLITATNRVAAGQGVRRLHVHCSPSFATLWLSPRLGSFVSQHPAIDISLFAGHEPSRLADDGILVDIQYGRPVPENCLSVPLVNETILPMASPAFLRRHAFPSPAAISAVPLIHSLRCVVSWEQWAARHAPAHPLNPRGLRFDRAYLALAAAADGLGLVMESNFQARTFLRDGRLVKPFGDLGLPIVAHRIVYRQQDQAHPDIAAFVAWVTQEMAQDNMEEASASTTGIS
jgi:LysR family transcriptional regulator, glycine cleavage system transcriptional activator